MRNQKGEIVTGVMVVMMVVMMLFGGMHLMHGDHRHGDEGGRSEHEHDRQHEQDKDGMHDMDNDDGTNSNAHEEGK